MNCAPRVPIFCAAVSLAVLLATPVSTPAVADYYKALWRQGPSLGPTYVCNHHDASPPGTPCGFDDHASDGTNSFHLWSYAARTEIQPNLWHSIELHGQAVTYSQYVVEMEWRVNAGWRWDDVTFTCQDGRTQVSVGLPIHVKGYASNFTVLSSIAPRGRALLYLGHPQYLYTQGVWHAGSNNGGSAVPEAPSTGVFAGSTGNALDQTVMFRIGEPPSAMVPTGTPRLVAPQFTLVFDVRNERVDAYFDPAYGGELSLRHSGPVFDLPAGCTCNSQQMGIVNNQWIGDVIAVQPHSWGYVKSLYR